MRIYDGFPFAVEDTPRIVALGFFDGLHLGHRALIKRLKERADKLHALATVFTFADHPDTVFEPEMYFRGLIMSAERRLKTMAELGVDEVVNAPLIPEVYTMSAKDFFDKQLRDCLRAKSIVVGRDFRFGHHGQGNVALLKQWCAENAIELHVIDDVIVDGEKVSSTRIRTLLRSGKIEEANRCLGAPYTIGGKVIHGRQLGRLLGFPTINVQFDPKMVRPLFGVYASSVLHHGEALPGITNIGIKPTVDPDNPLIQSETHIYSEDMDLYDKSVDIQLLAFIREEVKFSSVDALKRQVDRDKATVLEYHRNKKQELNHGSNL